MECLASAIENSLATTRNSYYCNTLHTKRYYLRSSSIEAVGPFSGCSETAIRAHKK